MAVFSLFLGRLAKVPSDGIPYPLFSLAGLVPWMFFASGLGQSSASLITNSNLIRKVYFPRLVIPISTVLAGMVDLGLSAALLGVVMLYYRVGVTMHTLLALVFLTLVVAISMGVGLWLSALTIQFRDIRHVVPFLTQFWMFATPVLYPSSLLASRWHVLYSLNPMVGTIEGFRWTLLSTSTAPGPMVYVSTAVALTLMVSGAFYFRRVEKSLVDVL
jgi:lipopolysaccharide transport system permease protein